MAKKIVICCDGTGNEIKENQSNVLKFYRVLKESADQIGFYDPGVGTISNSGAWSRFKNRAKECPMCRHKIAGQFVPRVDKHLRAEIHDASPEDFMSVKKELLAKGLVNTDFEYM